MADLICPECGATESQTGRQFDNRLLAMHRSVKHGVKSPNSHRKKEPSPAEVYVGDATSPDDLFAPPVDAGLDNASPFMAPPGPSAEIPPVPSGGGGSAGAPAPRRRGLFDRFKRTQTTAPVPGVPRQTNERAPKPAKVTGGRRLSAAETLTDLWSGGGSLVARTGHVPTGRMLQFQSPAAGEMLDDALKGTVFDKLILQRIVGGRSTIDTMFALFGPPVCAWQMEKAVASGDQRRVEFAETALKAVIKQSLPVMLPAMKKAKKKEMEQAQAMTELLEVADLEYLGVRVVNGLPVNEAGVAVDVGDILVAMLFAEWVPPAPPEVQPESETING